MSDSIDIRRCPDVGNTAQNGMLLQKGVKHASSAFLAVGPVMVHPRVAQDLLAKSAGPLPSMPIVLDIGALLVVFVSKSMGAGPQSDNRFAALQLINKMFHL